MLNRRYLSAPLNVCFSITNLCNLRCKHCCNDIQRRKKDLSFEKITNILDQLKEAKVFKVQVFGGEPFLREDIFEILSEIKKRGMQISLNSNCTLIDDRTIKGLKKLGIRGLCTSLDGSSAKIHDKLRGKGAFDKTISGINELIKAGFRLSAEAVVTKFNLRDLPNIAKKAKEIGLREMVFVPVFYGGQAKCFQSDLAPQKEDYALGIEIAKELIRKYRDFARGAFLDGFEKIEQFKTLKKTKNVKVKPISLCGAGRSVCAIRSDGAVTPCSGFWDLTAGSLKKKTFKDIWENSNVLKEFRSLDKHSLDSIPECKACEYKYFCTGNCRASAYYYSGSILGFTPDCNYFRPYKLPT